MDGNTGTAYPAIASVEKKQLCRHSRPAGLAVHPTETIVSTGEGCIFRPGVNGSSEMSVSKCVLHQMLGYKNNPDELMITSLYGTNS